jgi:hypothetical protein
LHDLFQTRDYVKMASDTCIRLLLQTHDWSTPTSSKKESDDSPIADDAAKMLYELRGPMEDTADAGILPDKMGFSYRQLLGEPMYAYVVVRPELGFAVCLLARFSSTPHEKRRIAQYLRRTIDWGIIYWRPSPLQEVRAVHLPPPPEDDSLPVLPQPEPLVLTGYMDVAHATDMILRKSVTGLLFKLAGGVIAYKSKIQVSVETSSTEDELYAYLRSILDELGFVQNGPTMLHEDKQAMTNIVNNSHPTSRTQHV